MNYIFFEANGYMKLEQLQDAYYEFIFSELLFAVPYVFILFIILFFSGHYVAGILLRPFYLIGDYCEKSMKGETVKWKADLFCDLKVLTEFGEFFFEWIQKSKEKGAFQEVTIPPFYRRIHRPIFEFSFFINFGLLVILSAIISSGALYATVVSTHGKIVELSLATLNAAPSINFFLNEQKDLLMLIMSITVSMLTVLYIWLALDLFAQVSGASFAIFSTMRSFMKGDYSARVHLIGYSYLRDSSRQFNKYLDFIQKNYIQNKNNIK